MEEWYAELEGGQTCASVIRLVIDWADIYLSCLTDLTEMFMFMDYLRFSHGVNYLTFPPMHSTNWGWGQILGLLVLSGRASIDRIQSPSEAKSWGMLNS